MKNETIAWFSAGATSAIACKIALSMYNNVRIVYIETGSGHSDNERFIQECEQWYGQKIERIRSDKFSNVEDVLLKTKYINGTKGAPCTLHLKKQVRYKFEDEIRQWAGQVWGFDYCKREINRAIRFRQQNPRTKPIFPLIEHTITKQDALAMLQRAKIELPMMYQLGYSNNNCIGCVKGGISYWNKIRRDFPAHFKRMSEIERTIGATCLKDKNGRIWLDELSPKRCDSITPLYPECSIICEIEFANIEDKQTQLVIDGKLNINETK